MFGCRSENFHLFPSRLITRIMDGWYTEHGVHGERDKELDIGVKLQETLRLYADATLSAHADSVF